MAKASFRRFAASLYLFWSLNFKRVIINTEDSEKTVIKMKLTSILA